MAQISESPTAVMSLPDGSGTTSLADLERCRTCGTRFARDQRYCLNCGTSVVERRPMPAAEAEAAPAAAAASTGGISPAMAAAGVCLSVLFLAAGVLVGRSNSGSTKAAPAAPIVVQGGGGAGTAAAADPGASASTGAGAGAGASTPAATAPPKLTAADKAKAKKAAAQINQLNHLSGKDYSKQSAKLPKQYVTPGKLPPADGGTPGGGSSATTIG